MSNIAARSFVDSNSVGHRHLFHGAAVALALATAFVIVSIPKPETAAVGAADDGAQVAAQSAPEAAPQEPSCLETCCLQTWPYYQGSCLHDSRQHDGNARTVRLIAAGGQAPPRAARH